MAWKKWFGKREEEPPEAKETSGKPPPPPPAAEAPPAAAPPSTPAPPGRALPGRPPAAPPPAAPPPAAPPPAAPPAAAPPAAAPPPAAPPAAARPGGAPPPAEGKPGRWARLKAGLRKTREGMRSLFSFRGKLDEATIDQIERQLFQADFGPDMVRQLIDGEEGVRQAWKAGKIDSAEEVVVFLKERLKTLLTRRSSALARADGGLTVYLVAGVNGTGKTTSIAKLARRLKTREGSTLLAAADTFRAAAVEQLRVWSERLGVEIVTGKPQADPASVVYQGLERAVSGGFDFLIVDTAGRLHTQKNLMRELRKIRDVIARKVPGGPHESLLVLDATTGQNAVNQAQTFKQEIDISGIILAKLDGTAKGGIVVAINNRLDIPVKLVGVGEGLEDLEEFDAASFVEALFED
jgi:fused signal recognition particle receptor